jgi:cysteinyl-tRNA synthetase
MDTVLGLDLAAARPERLELEEDMMGRIREREEARKARDFGRADRIRDELRARGILLEDTPEGVRWRKG